MAKVITYPSKARQRCGPKEGQALVRDFEASGLTAAEFCRHHQISRTKLTYWQERVESSQADESQGDFIEMQPQVLLSNEQEQTALEIVTPSDVLVRVPITAPRALIFRILKRLVPKVPR